VKIDAEGMYYRELNDRIHAALKEGAREIVLDNVRGQRYIGAGLDGGVQVVINGMPGNDLAAFMDGAEIVVKGNGQDGVGNTMNAGKVVIDGDVGDVLGYSMRGGQIFVRGNAGYRTGIHMKEFGECRPVVVIGGRAMDYLGEYMAGGILIVLGLDSPDSSPVGEYVGTGMHGGAIYIHGSVEPYQLGREVGVDQIDDSTWAEVEDILSEYSRALSLEGLEFERDDFVRLFPKTTRPYGRLYAY
jgi:glutamate synthase domain-containing protein 3